MKTKLKDNKIFRWIIIPICLAMCFLGRFIPPIGPLSSDAIGVLGIFLGTLILWLTIDIGWPSLVAILALGLIPCLWQMPTGDPEHPFKSMPFVKVFNSSFGDKTFLFLLFTFICTYALSKTSFIRRIAISFVNSKFAKKNGFCFVFMFLSAVLLLGLFISPTVLFVVMLPILNEIFDVANIDKKDKLAKVLMIGLGFTVSLSSGMTPIAHVFPIIAMNNAEVEVSYIAYMGFAIPVGLILFFLMLGMLFLFIKPDIKKTKGLDVSKLKENLPKTTKSDIATLSIFIFVIILWIFPAILKDVHPFFKELNKFNPFMPPLIGAILLLILRFDNKPILELNDALKNGVPWKSLIMCAGSLAISMAIKDPSVGISTYLENNLAPMLSTVAPILLLIFFLSWAIIQTNLTSNMVTAQLVALVAMNVLNGAQTGLSLPVLAALIGMLASFAFATPPSMPHIAIISSSESCNTKDVLIYGSIMMVLSLVITLLVGYPLGTLIV